MTLTICILIIYLKRKKQIKSLLAYLYWAVCINLEEKREGGTKKEREGGGEEGMEREGEE